MIQAHGPAHQLAFVEHGQPGIAVRIVRGAVHGVVAGEDIPLMDPGVVLESQVCNVPNNKGHALDMPGKAVGGGDYVPLRIGEHEQQLTLDHGHGVRGDQLGGFPCIDAGGHEPHLEPHELGRIILHQLEPFQTVGVSRVLETLLPFTHDFFQCFFLITDPHALSPHLVESWYITNRCFSFNQRKTSHLLLSPGGEGRAFSCSGGIRCFFTGLLMH